MSLNLPNDYLSLVGATIYTSPAEEPVYDGVLLIHGGKVAAVGGGGNVQVPQTAQVLDGSGLTITAEFWNSHVHFFERKLADAAKTPAHELTR